VGETANEIYIDPTNSQIIWVATSSGLYKSINGGTTWGYEKDWVTLRILN
jgi:hypothetical protein